jgi:phage baseplate assembly protein W
MTQPGNIFGTDLWGVSDMDPAGAEVTGDLLVGQAIARRLSTPRGALIDDPNYGYDLTAWLNADVGPQDLGQIQANTQAECLKDQRIVSATVTVTPPASAIIHGVTAIYMMVTIALTTGAGPFTLTLAVSSLTVTLMQAST